MTTPSIASRISWLRLVAAKQLRTQVKQIRRTHELFFPQVKAEGATWNTLTKKPDPNGTLITGTTYSGPGGIFAPQRMSDIGNHDSARRLLRAAGIPLVVPEPTPEGACARLPPMTDSDSSICGATYYTPRRVNQFPQKMTCTKLPHEGRRHGQAKAPPAADAEPSGTCQVCFRSQQTRAGLLVLHGYKRPGHGYIIGECWGFRYAPFEVSCERTKEYLEKVLRATLTRWEANLARLQARPDDLPYEGQVYVGYFHPRAVHRSPYAIIPLQVARDAPAGWVKTDIVATKDTRWSAGPVVLKGDFEQVQHPSYDDLLTSAIRDQEGKIRMVKQDIASYEKKVAEWKPAPWPAQTAVA